MNYKREYKRVKTKLEILEGIALTTMFVGVFLVGIMR